MYPNPATDAVMVNAVFAAGQPVRYQLLDVSGRLVLAGTLAPSRRLLLTNIPAGLYWLVLRDGVDTKRAPLVIQ